MAVTVNRSGVLIFLVVLMICMTDATIQTTKLSNNNDIVDNGSHGNEFQPRKHKYHHLLFLGGLKGWIALVLIKAKIILVSVVVAAIIFAFKFADIFKRPLPYSSPYPISYEPAYDFGPTVHLDHSSRDRYGNDWGSSNNYAQRVSESKKPYSNNYSGGKRSTTRRRRG